MSGSWKGLVLRALLVAGIAMGSAGATEAASVPINSAQAPLPGNAERKISLRHLDRMRGAPSGKTCVIVNRGGQGRTRILQRYSTPGRGLSWAAGPMLVPQQYPDNNLDRLLAFNVPLP